MEYKRLRRTSKRAVKEKNSVTTKYLTKDFKNRQDELNLQNSTRLKVRPIKNSCFSSDRILINYTLETSSLKQS